MPLHFASKNVAKQYVELDLCRIHEDHILLQSGEQLIRQTLLLTVTTWAVQALGEDAVAPAFELAGQSFAQTNSIVYTFCQQTTPILWLGSFLLKMELCFTV